MQDMANSGGIWAYFSWRRGVWDGRQVQSMRRTRFHGYVAQGIYPENWGNEIELPDITAGE